MTKCETVNKVGSDQWKKSFTNYDHKHWSRLNDEPLDSEMGTISGDTSDLGKKGDIVFLGRLSDGKHHTLYGPITPEEYKKILHKNNQSLKIILDVSRNLE